MIEVGIASVEAVFDWRAYLKENFGKSYPKQEENKGIPEMQEGTP